MARLRPSGRDVSLGAYSSSSSPERTTYEDDTDFFTAGRNDSQSSLGVSSPRDSSTLSPSVEEIERARCLCPISRLPAEVLIGIFARLVSTADIFTCMQVSKTWAKNCAEILWHRPLCNTRQHLKSVTQSIQKPDTYFGYSALVRRLNLSSLSESVKDESVESFAQCKRIERLTLTGCKELTDSGLSSLLHGSRSLLALDITGLGKISDSAMLAIGQNCHRLQGLNVTDCVQISDTGLSSVAEHCHCLKRLKLNNCSLLTDDSVLKIAQNCSYMLEIDLYQCRRISNASITALMRCGRQLRELRVGHCHLLNDRAFLDLPRTLQLDSLRILDLTACHHLHDDAVEAIVHAAPRLRNLVLAKCREITDRAVMSISRLGRNLHYIHLGHCMHLTDDAIKQLIKQCNRIRYIDLACCIRLTDESVKELATLPKLRRVGLVKCQAITNYSIMALAKADPRHRYKPSSPSLLERVHLSYCIHLTLQGIHALINQCPRLTHLSLTGVQAFYGDSNLAAHCREAPPEFTEHQRNVFCVFSGDGVTRLRDYLNTVPNPQLLNNTLTQMELFHPRRFDPADQVNAMMHAASINDDDEDAVIDAEAGEESQDGGEG